MVNSSISQADAELVFEEIRSIEAAAVMSPRVRPRWYWTGGRGDWFVQSAFLPRLVSKTLFRKDILPIARWSLLGQLFRLSGRGGLATASLRADLVNVRRTFRRNGIVRCFYYRTDHPVSIKAAIQQGPGGSPSIDNELRNRRIVEEVGKLTVPRVLAQDVAGPSPYLVEEALHAEVPSRKEHARYVEGVLLPQLLDHYRGFGIQFRSVEECFGSDFIPRALGAVEPLPWAADWIPRDRLFRELDRLEQRAGLLPCSFCHADLNLDHVAITDDGRVILIDWASARETAVAVDMAELHRSIGGTLGDLRPGVTTLLAAIAAGESRCFSPIDQLVVAALWKTTQLDLFTARWAQENRGEGAASLRMKMAGRTLQYLRRLLD